MNHLFRQRVHAIYVAASVFVIRCISWGGIAVLVFKRLVLYLTVAPRCSSSVAGNFGGLKALGTHGQKVSCSLTLRHKADVVHLTSSHRVAISRHHRRGEYSTKRYSERDYCHTTFITVYYCIILVLFYYCCLSLTVPNL